MIDDLVARLREAALDYYYEDIIAAAAERIEELQKQRVASDKRIEELEEQIFDMEYEMFERGERS